MTSAESPSPRRLRDAGPRLLHWLREPVDGSSLAVFRILFGLILLVDVVRYWKLIAPLWIKPIIHFTYYGFGWVSPWPGDGMYWHFGLMGLMAACIMLGVLYRLAAILFFCAFSYVFLLEQTAYLNHFYLVALLAFLMCWLPAHSTWSLDARGSARPGFVPRWAPLSLVVLMEVVLVYAGLVKINADWLQGYPLRMWFAERAGQHDLLQPLLGSEAFAVASSYFAIALHLVGAPLLFFRRTRLAVFLVYAIFHLSNAVVWNIGIFPFITIAGTLMFFDPDWPRALLRRLARGPVAPGLAPPPPIAAEFSIREKVTLLVVAAFLAFNVLFPMRPLLYPGDVTWSEEGHMFSWRMKLRDKECKARFGARDPVTGKVWMLPLHELLSPYQIRKFASSPDMVLQMAHQLVPLVRERTGIAEPEVRAFIKCSLNGRPFAFLVDPMRDLAKVERNLSPADWIEPLDPELKPGTHAAERDSARNAED